ncbi:MAG: ORF6N domain-containing protein [Candidatus Moraniibacteriota bacterium]
MKNKKTIPKQKSLSIIPDERIVGKIYLIRGEKVMFDRDLAELYEVETKALNRAVKRNIKRFPADFMFQLDKNESEIFSRYHSGTLKEDANLKSQIVTSRDDKNLRYQIGTSRSQIVTLKKGQNIKYRPYVFTEQGVAMLSAVLKSERAIEVSIQIVRVFIKMKKLLTTHKELREKIEKMEKSNKENFTPLEIFKNKYYEMVVHLCFA